MNSSPIRRPGSVPDFAVSPLVGALNREWHCRYECRAAPTPESWRADPHLSCCLRVVDVLALLENPAVPPVRVERTLCRLADRAAAGDHDAARVVVQYLLPFLVRVAFRRRTWGERSREQVLDDLLSVAWVVVRTGVERSEKPMRIALLRAIEYRALKQPVRVAQRQAAREMFIDGVGCHVVDLTGLPTRPNPGEEVLGLLAEATRHGLSADDARLLGELSVGGATCARLATAEGVSDRTIRNRRAAAMKRLAEIAA